MKYFLILILSLMAFNAVSNEAKQPVKEAAKLTRQPSSEGEIKCSEFFSKINSVAMTKILNENCNPDRFIQVFKNESSSYEGYCCVSK